MIEMGSCSVICNTFVLILFLSIDLSNVYFVSNKSKQCLVDTCAIILEKCSGAFVQGKIMGLAINHGEEGAPKQLGGQEKFRQGAPLFRQSFKDLFKIY